MTSSTDSGPTLAERLADVDARIADAARSAGRDPGALTRIVVTKFHPAQLVTDLAALMQAWPDREFNIEGNPTQNLMDFVRAVRPHQCTFVPDSESQPTSDHGCDLSAATGNAERLRPLIAEARALRR